MEAAQALTELGGIASWGQIVARTTPKRVRRAVERGDIVKISRNRYCLPTADLDLAAVIRLRGHLSHLSAAEHYGWEVCFSPDRPQMIIPTGRKLALGDDWGVDVRRHDLLPSETAGWATPPILTVLLCARDLPPRDALAVADSALRHGAFTSEELVAASDRWEGEGRARVRAVAAYADERADNPFESALRAHAITAGLGVIPQHAVTVGPITYHPDLADPLRGIVLEADSWTHHAASSADHDRDCERYNALVLADWRVLRFTWSQVMLDGDRVVDTIRRARVAADALRGATSSLQ